MYYKFNDNSSAEKSIGANASVGNYMFPLFEDSKMTKNGGYIMFTYNSRNISNVLFQNYFCGLFLNDGSNSDGYPDLLTINYCEVNDSNPTQESPAGTQTVAKATYSTGTFQNKDVTVTINYKIKSLREIIIEYI